MATLDVLVNDSDPDGDPLTIAAVSPPSIGSVVNNGDNLSYTADVFGALESQIATLGLNAGNQNALLASLRAAERSLARGNRRAAENQLKAFLNKVRAFERSGRIGADQAAALTALVQGWLSGSLTDSFSYTVSDGNGGTDTATVAVTIVP